MEGRLSLRRRARVGSGALVLAVAVAVAPAGCSTTKFYEREKLSDRCMTFDADGRMVYLRNKTEAAREGGFGGFGGAAVGSCGCQ